LQEPTQRRRIHSRPKIIKPIRLGIDAGAGVAEGSGDRAALAESLIACLGDGARARVERADDRALDVGDERRPRAKIKSFATVDHKHSINQQDEKTGALAGEDRNRFILLTLSYIDRFSFHLVGNRFS
jgi:hypothetical protein